VTTGGGDGLGSLGPTSGYALDSLATLPTTLKTN